MAWLSRKSVLGSYKKCIKTVLHTFLKVYYGLIGGLCAAKAATIRLIAAPMVVGGVLDQFPGTAALYLMSETHVVV